MSQAFSASLAFKDPGGFRLRQAQSGRAQRNLPIVAIGLFVTKDNVLMVGTDAVEGKSKKLFRSST